MSTTFEVYPQSTYIPTFTEILAVSQQKMKGFLEDYGVQVHPDLAVQLRTKTPDTILSLPFDQRATWSQDNYAWFYLQFVSGGTDAYFSYLDPEDHEYWDELCLDNERVSKRQELIRVCLTQGYYWTFRRSAGQSCLINLAYGLIAASFAELTSGFIYSDDGAWDYERFPATALEFSAWYFRPEQAISVNNKHWAENCLDAIVREFRG